MRRIKQQNKDAGEIRKRALKAFAELRKSGYVARANFSCCGTCATSELADYVNGVFKRLGKKIPGAVYWHHQDNERLLRDGRFYVGFGSYGEEVGNSDVQIGKDLVAALKKNGLIIEWNGRAETRVYVKGLEYGLFGSVENAPYTCKDCPVDGTYPRPCEDCPQAELTATEK
jgi:hypothetical protein